MGATATLREQRPPTGLTLMSDSHHRGRRGGCLVRPVGSTLPRAGPAGCVSELDGDSLMATLRPVVPDGNSGGPKLHRTIRILGGRPLCGAARYLPLGESLGRRNQAARYREGTDHTHDRDPEVIVSVVNLVSPGKISHRARPQRP